MKATVLATLEGLERDAWLELRRRGLGSSDAAAVLGVSPFATPLQVWAEKVGVVEPAPESEAMRWGRILEPIVADEYARETGRELVNPQTLYQHPDLPWCLATPDRLTADGRLVVEIKTASAYRAEEWAEEPPVHYQVQCQHLLAVLGLDLASLVVLVGGQRLLWRDLARNDKFIALMLEREREFWRRVELRDPPPPGAEDRELLRALYPRDTGATIELPAEAAEWDRELEEAKAQIRHWTTVRDSLEARICNAIGEATYGVLPGGGRYSWKVVRQEIPPQPARTREYRVLRRLER